jgi:drug/metabolite transporter (DMT)-like permease
VIVVAAGVLLVRGARGGRGAALGLAIAGVIGGYTLIDRYGIRHAGAFSYALLIMLGPALVYPPFVGARRVRAAVSPTTLLVGVLSAGAYLLVLLALRRASAPAVSAVRETGVVIAAVLAAVVLRERVGLVRLAGAVLVAAGIALLAFG